MISKASIIFHTYGYIKQVKIARSVPPSQDKFNPGEQSLIQSASTLFKILFSVALSQRTGLVHELFLRSIEYFHNFRGFSRFVSRSVAKADNSLEFDRLIFISLFL